MNVEACDKCKSLNTTAKLFYVTRYESTTYQTGTNIVQSKVYMGFRVTPYKANDPLIYPDYGDTSQLCYLCLAERVTKYTKEWQGL